MNKIKKGDNVQILLGKDRGKTGTIEKVLLKKAEVVVPGINVYKRHIKKGLAGNEGGVVELSKPLDISNVMLVCPSCKKPTRVGVKVEGEENVRFCKKCKKEIK
jgi:large subunit ribosomal protein L24